MGEFRNAFVIGEKILIDVFRGRRDETGAALPYGDVPDEHQEYDGPPHDLIVTTGRVYIAKRINVDSNVQSWMGWMEIGTGTAAPALTDGSTPGLYGAINRKALALGSTLNNDNNWSAIASWGGVADGVQSIAIVEAGVFNHVSSGQGTEMQRVTFSAVTLAGSDLLKITLVTNIGSS